MTLRQKRLGRQKCIRSSGSYNKIIGNRQRIRISEGCPNMCQFCYEPPNETVFPIPKIEKNYVEIMDMNLLSKPNAKEVIIELGSKKVNNNVVYYELICGIDYRFLNQEMANLLYKNRFKRIRIAWDSGYKKQKLIKEAIGLLIDAGYKSNDITVFMICNWKIPYEENVLKLDLCKVWNVKVADCYYDNQVKINKTFIPEYWTTEQALRFRKKVRKHNQLVNFKIDPEIDKEVKK